jgi:predicted nucleotidyltransferase
MVGCFDEGRTVLNPSIRTTTAQKILALFKSDPRVSRAYLRGSLSQGPVDEYSDIDIGVDVSGYDNAAYCQIIIDTMNRMFPLHFHDWACSLMPDSYVITFYIKGLPIFWNVDFECVATPHHARLTREAVESDAVSGLLKVWALNAKYLLRKTPGSDKQAIEFGQRALGLTSLGKMNAIEVMSAVLTDLRAKAQPQHREFVLACEEVCDRHLLPLARLPDHTHIPMPSRPKSPSS